LDRLSRCWGYRSIQTETDQVGHSEKRIWSAELFSRVTYGIRWGNACAGAFWRIQCINSPTFYQFLFFFFLRFTLHPFVVPALLSEQRIP
jgi:hypothetical protein